MRSVFSCLKNVCIYNLLVDTYVYIIQIINNRFSSFQNKCSKNTTNQLDLINYSSMIYTGKSLNLYLLNKSFTHNPQGLLLR